MQREVALVSKLGHPCIIRFVEAQLAPPTPYIVTEFAPGVTLEKLAPVDERRPAPIPVEIALGIVAELLRAADFLEQKALVHRDIKPSNVVVGFDGRVRLIDFGLVLELGGARLSLPDEPIGTPAYVAPEVARHDEADHRADLYSIFVVLWELLTGRPLRSQRKGNTAAVIQHRGATRPSVYNPALRAALDDLVLRGLEQMVDERLDRAAQVREVVRGFGPAKQPAIGAFVRRSFPELSRRSDDFFRRSAAARTASELRTVVALGLHHGNRSAAELEVSEFFQSAEPASATVSMDRPFEIAPIRPEETVDRAPVERREGATSPLAREAAGVDRWGEAPRHRRGAQPRARPGVGVGARVLRAVVWLGALFLFGLFSALFVIRFFLR